MKLLPVLLLSMSVYGNESDRLEIRDMLINGHRPLTDWRQAKRYLFQNIYLEKDSSGYFVKDVYCNKTIRDSVGPKSKPLGSIINIEHTWPQSKFPVRGSRKQKSDLHHLFPTDTYANRLRGNFVFSNLSDESNIDGCKSSRVGFSPEAGEMSFQPPSAHRGNVARALFYFAVRYNGKINDDEEIFLKLWHLIDPVDQIEIERNNRIEKIQGNRNIFIDEPDFVTFIEDF